MKKISCAFIVLAIIFIFFTPIWTGLCLYKRTEKMPNPENGDFEVSVFYHTDPQIKKVNLEEYLIGVLAAEMPAEYHLEALKAQAVAARSYILKKTKTASDIHPDAAVCTNPDHCKASIDEEMAKSRWKDDKKDEYWEKLREAVYSTKGEYMVYEDEVVEAFFFARSGGRTENSEDVWNDARPYLKSVESKEDISHPEFLSTAEFLNKAAREILSAEHSEIKKGNQKIHIGKITKTEGGNIREIEIEGKTFKGTKVRQLFGLKSADFDVKTTEEKVIFTVRGYGHGVGMSQFGANCMAKNGKNYTEILSHYYTNIQIVKFTTKKSFTP